MRDRKTFLAALGVTSAALALGRQADAQSQPTPSAAPSREPPSPAPSESASARPKPPSAAALAMAATFRRFDPELSDVDVTTIARGIDDSMTAGATLNPKKKPLHNGDEPVTTFSVPG